MYTRDILVISSYNIHLQFCRNSLIHIVHLEIRTFDFFYPNASEWAIKKPFLYKILM